MTMATPMRAAPQAANHSGSVRCEWESWNEVYHPATATEASTIGSPPVYATTTGKPRNGELNGWSQKT